MDVSRDRLFGFSDGKVVGPSSINLRDVDNFTFFIDLRLYLRCGTLLLFRLEPALILLISVYLSWEYLQGSLLGLLKVICSSAENLDHSLDKRIPLERSQKSVLWSALFLGFALSTACDHPSSRIPSRV
jgi:hypothetical protein